jgi:hypothetical protein
MRGAGDSFGIAVRFYLNTESVPPMVTHFTYEMVSWMQPKYMAVMFYGVQKCVQDPATSSPKMGLTVRLVSGGFGIEGYYYGNDKDPEFVAMSKCIDKGTYICNTTKEYELIQ